MPIQLEINRKSYSLRADPDTPLLSALREELGLTGSKYGCGEGQCGACTVLVDGVARRSCLFPVSDAAGKSITTVEGLEKGGALHPVQEASGRRCLSMRVLHFGNDHEQPGTAAEKPQPIDGGNCASAARQYVPLRNPNAHCCGGAAGGQSDARAGTMSDSESNVLIEPERYEFRTPAIHHFELRRRDFFKLLGAGIAIFRLPSMPQAHRNRVAGAAWLRGEELPKDITSWLHIGEDGQVTVFTGKVEIWAKHSDFTERESVADELRVRGFESVRMVMGDTAA